VCGIFHEEFWILHKEELLNYYRSPLVVKGGIA